MSEAAAPSPSPAPRPAAAPAAAAAKPLPPGAPPAGQYTRRDFLILLGWSWLTAALGGWLAAVLRYMFPNVLYEPNPSFKAGRPSEYPVKDGKPTVSLRWQAEQRVWIVSTNEGIYAFEARCTHLGCTPRWVEENARFECPCHGSNFNPEGDVIAGPAPKPLWRLAVSLSQDGQIVVNKALRSNIPSERKSDKFFLSRSRFA